MKSNRNVLVAALLASGALLAAGAGISTAGAADDSAADAAAATPPPGPHGWHHHGGPWHLLGKLGLSAAQQQSIKDIMTASRPPMPRLREPIHANSLKLRQTQPTDPNYSSIVAQASQTHGSLSAQMVSQMAEVRAQVFKVLTPAQQTQLAALEAQRQEKMQAHRHGAWGGPHGPGPQGPGAAPAPGDQ